MPLEQRRPYARIIPMKRYDSYRPYIDPNSPTSPQYAERHRRKVTEVMPGIKRVDIGCEGD